MCSLFAARTPVARPPTRVRGVSLRCSCICGFTVLHAPQIWSLRAFADHRRSSAPHRSSVGEVTPAQHEDDGDVVGDVILSPRIR